MKSKVKWILTAFGVVTVVILFRTLLFTLCSIPSRGMEGNLLQGDRIYVTKWAYGYRLPYSTLRIKERQPKHGDILLFNNPVDTAALAVYNKSLYLSRCVGLPGDTIYVDTLFHYQDSYMYFNPDQKQLYSYPRIFEDEIDSLLTLLRINSNSIIGQDSMTYIRSFTAYEHYLLTQATVGLDSLQIKPNEANKQLLYPIEVPKKDKSIQITPWNRVLIYNTILLHENKNIRLKNNQLVLNEKPITQYTFTQNYYWMAANNSINLSDSRLFGFVPHSHLIGKASFIWFSKDPLQSFWKGYRWDRFFNSIY